MYSIRIKRARNKSGEVIMRGSIFMSPNIFRVKAAATASMIRNKMTLLLSIPNLQVIVLWLVYVYAKSGESFRDIFVKR
jgi:hypothetical protein